MVNRKWVDDPEKNQNHNREGFHYKGHHYNHQGVVGLECHWCGAVWRTPEGMLPCRIHPNVFLGREVKGSFGI